MGARLCHRELSGGPHKFTTVWAQRGSPESTLIAVLSIDHRKNILRLSLEKLPAGSCKKSKGPLDSRSAACKLSGPVRIPCPGYSTRLT